MKLNKKTPSEQQFVNLSDIPLIYPSSLQVTLDDQEACIGIPDDQPLVFFPSAFDPIDCQLAKLELLNFCFPSLVKEENGK